MPNTAGFYLQCRTESREQPRCILDLGFGVAVRNFLFFYSNSSVSWVVGAPIRGVKFSATTTNCTEYFSRFLGIYMMICVTPSGIISVCLLFNRRTCLDLGASSQFQIYTFVTMFFNGHSQFGT